MAAVVANNAEKTGFNSELLSSLTHFEMMLPDFLDSKGRELALEALNDIKRAMTAANYSQKIIDGTTLENFRITPDGFLEFEIRSEHDADSFDVATAREKGTSTHRIQPKDPDGVLSWIQNGKRFFSKGHTVSGIQGSNIITQGLAASSVKIQNELNAATDRFFAQVVNE